MKLCHAVLAAAVLLGAPACMPGAAGVLAQIATVISDAGQVLSLADIAWRTWARANPPSEADQRRFERLMADSHRSLSIASSAVSGAESMDQKDYDAAFASFRKAYGELNAFLTEKGVVGPPGMTGGVGVAGAVSEPLPEPAALSFKVGQ